MFSPDALLGLPLDRAEQMLEACGVKMEIITSRAPRTERTGGTPRVVRVQDGAVTVCDFPDGVPTRSAD
ncbi:MAG: hypothetical protein Q4C54_10085 [Clostridia bacterium]|nr:hypothetical protein [Clostridia bacterium]